MISNFYIKLFCKTETSYVSNQIQYKGVFKPETIKTNANYKFANNRKAIINFI